MNDNDATCGGNSPCYSTIQEALNAAADGGLIKVHWGTYNESPTRSTSGTATISGGWNDDFNNQTGTTEMYAPVGTGDGGVRVLPNIRIMPR